MRRRVYLDWNASAPLRPEAQAAMLAAMDFVGNPSSVHAEGRAAKAMLERSRGQLAAAIGADGADIVFTSGATEAAALGLSGRGLSCAAVEHPAVRAWCDVSLPVDPVGHIIAAVPRRATVQLANSETGIVQALPAGVAVCDATQAFGKLPVRFDDLGCDMALLSAHKIGGPKGAGALVLRRGLDLAPAIKGGGQEMGRRSGTENLVGIAGFAAAAAAAARDLDAGAWDEVAELRNILENALASCGNKTIFVGKAGRRLPNTTMAVTPGWKGETQVMAMDLAGFAVSAGSACSSGKVRDARILRALGLNEEAAASGLRISLGPGVTRDEIEDFAEAWSRAARKHRARAA